MVGFPLLLIPLALYNIIVFLMPSVSLADTVVTVPLPSGAAWPVNLNDMLLALGILLLLLEVIKGARPGSKFVMDHLLSLIVFGAAAAEFVLWPKFGTSTFCLLTLLALVDFISGIALRARRTTRWVREIEPAPRRQQQAEPMPQQAPAPVAPAAPAPQPVPPAAPIADSLPHDYSKPAPTQPTVASPELQPDRNPPAEPDQR